MPVPPLRAMRLNGMPHSRSVAANERGLAIQFSRFALVVLYLKTFKHESEPRHDEVFSVPRTLMELACLSRDARPSDQSGIAFDRLDHRVHLPAQHLFGEAEGEACDRMKGKMRRQ